MVLQKGYLYKLAGLGLLISLISGCWHSEPKVNGRWYTPSQLELGQQVFADNCAQCHGVEAEGTEEWMKPLPNGHYPPPPLNGTAHAWHHPLQGLKASIREGGARFGGVMPGFGDRLTEAEQEAAIAFFQSKWSDDIYKMWLDRGGLK